MRGQKGANCLTTREFIRREVGEARYAAFLETLPAPLRELAVRKISPVEWVDFDAWMTLEQRFYDGLFGGDYDAYRRLTAKIVKHDFNTLYRAFIKLGSPAFLLERTAQAYAKFSTVGAMRCLRLEKRPTREVPSIVRLEGVPDWPAIVSSIHGAIEGLLELTRGKEPVVWVLSKGGSPAAVTVDFALTY